MIKKCNALIANMSEFLAAHTQDGVSLPNDGLFGVLPDELVLAILGLSDVRTLDLCSRFRSMAYDVLINKIIARGDAIPKNILWHEVVSYKPYQFTTHLLFLKFVYECKLSDQIYACRNMEMHYNSPSNMCFLYKKWDLVDGELTRSYVRKTADMPKCSICEQKLKYSYRN